MKILCVHCRKSFESDSEKFCSQKCKDEYLKGLTKRMDEAVKNDPSHSKNLSEWQTLKNKQRENIMPDLSDYAESNNQMWWFFIF